MTFPEQVYHYRFGDTVFEILTPIPIRQNPKYEEFRVPDTVPADVTFELVALSDDPLPDLHLVPHFFRVGNRIVIEFDKNRFPKVDLGSILSLTSAAFFFLEWDSFILHASYVLYRGEAMLFSAPSGTGKSTQAGWWQQNRGAEIINGDRVLISRKNGVFYANGIYASGKSGLCRNVTAPLGRIILLEQGDKNEILLLKALDKFMRLIKQSTYDVTSDSQIEKITSITADLVSSVPVIGYRCRNHPDSVDELERYLWKEPCK